MQGGEEKSNCIKKKEPYLPAEQGFAHARKKRSVCWPEEKETASE